MKYDLNFFLRKSQFALMAALGVLPLVLVLESFFAPEQMGHLVLLVLLYVALAVSAMVIPGKLRVWIGLLEAVCLVPLWAWLQGTDAQWVAALSAGVFSVLLIWSLQFGGMGQEDELPSYVTFVGLGLHVAAQLLVMIGPMKDFTQLEPVAPWLSATMAAFLFLAVLAANRKSLVKASTGRQEVPTAMRRRNLLMTVVVFAGALALSFSAAVGSSISQVTAWLIQLLMYLFFGTEELVPEPTEPVQTVPPTTDDLGALPPAPVMQTPPWVLSVIQLISIAVVIFLVYVAMRKLLRAMPGVQDALKKHFSASGEDYVDEVSNTREGGFADQIRSLRKNRENLVRESQLPPRERIRARYRKLLKKNPRWGSGRTARENLPEELASVYERARYSQHPITEEEAEQFRQNAKTL